MVLFNYAIREITAKLVYYGPGLCGKTTNLQLIHEKLDPRSRGKLLSLATDGDRTLFFDFLPIEMGSIGGYKVRFQLYTVPGQVHYNATRKLVLKGVDAVVFVADSQLSMVERNRESFENLIENLVENGYDPAKIPVVIQLNKRDLPNVASVEELVAAMGVAGYPAVEAVACRGDGVFETLKAAVKLTLSRLRTQFDTGVTGGAEQSETPLPPPPPPPSQVFAPPPPSEPIVPSLPPSPPVVFTQSSPSTVFPQSSPPSVVSPPPPSTISAPPPLSTVFPLPSAAAESDALPVQSDASTDGLEEFDLEEYSTDNVVDLEQGFEILLENQLAEDETIPDIDVDSEAVDAETESVVETESAIEAEGVPEAESIGEAEGVTDEEDSAAGAIAPEPAGEEAWLTPVSPDDSFPPVEETLAIEPPSWALEMQEELRRLRDENHELRVALRGLKTLLDHQIEVLGQGRDALDRQIGAGPGEIEP